MGLEIIVLESIVKKGVYKSEIEYIGLSKVLYRG